MRVTKQDITVEFRNHGRITIPAGTKTTHMTACGIDNNYNFIDEFDWIGDSMLRHDMAYYGYNVPDQFLTDNKT